MAKTSYRYCGSLIGLIAIGLGLQAAPASSASLGGKWSGTGFVKPTSGKRERVRCRVTYTRQSDKIFAVSARCASASTALRQTGELLKVRSNLFVGDFYNQQFDVRGRIRVVISGNTQKVTLSSKRGTGSLRLKKR